MSGYPGSPKLLRAGLVLIDPESGAIVRIIALQYNSETLQRTLRRRRCRTSPTGRSRCG